MLPASVPFRRLSGFYFFYFAVLGILVPFWPVYLKEIGFGAEQIGILSAIIMATKIVAPNIWGWLADHHVRRISVIRFGCFMATLTFAAIYYKQTFLWFAVVACAYSFFWNAVLAQFEVITLDHLNERPEVYSRVRLWGSVGFIVSVAGLGALFDVIDISYLPALVLIGLGLIWLSSITITEAPVHIDADDHASIWHVLKRPVVIYFLVVCFLMQVSHGPYYTFFSLYLESFNYSKTFIGELWALGVVAEVVLFWYMHRLMPYWGIRFLVIFSLWATTLRWLLIAFLPESLPVLLFAQCLHAFSFGAFHAVAIELVRQFFSAKHAGRGQALYSSVSFGAGSAVGAVASGYLWAWNDHYTFVLASTVSFIAMVLAWYGLRSIKDC